MDSEYNLEEINNKWRVKNIFIENFSLGTKINELIKDLISESIVVNSNEVNLNYVRFISNNTNIKLFYYDESVFRESKCPYLMMKIMLNNDDSIENINEQLMKSSKCGYLEVIKLLIESGADIKYQNNNAIINASSKGHLNVFPIIRLCRISRKQKK